METSDVKSLREQEFDEFQEVKREISEDWGYRRRQITKHFIDRVKILCFFLKAVG